MTALDLGALLAAFDLGMFAAFVVHRLAARPPRARPRRRREQQPTTTNHLIGDTQ